MSPPTKDIAVVIPSEMLKAWLRVWLHNPQLELGRHNTRLVLDYAHSLEAALAAAPPDYLRMLLSQEEAAA